MSGHYATLLRGTVEALLPDHDVHITDWADAREVPLAQGNFDLDDYVDYVMEFCRYLGPDVHVIAVCQPSVPVMAAAALMAADKDPRQPKSITLMGGPIDTRVSPTTPNDLAMRNSMMWFRQNVISTVPFAYPGAMRRVYPGFLQLTSFISMNLDRHINAHMRQFEHLVKGDDDSADGHRAFYDEYLAVMDLTAEFYLQTIEVVFKEHQLPRGDVDEPRPQGRSFRHRDRADDGRGRARRHLRHRPDQGRARAHAEHPRRTPCALGAATRWSLRHLQRPQVARADHAARPRLHPRQRRALSACTTQPHPEERAAGVRLEGWASDAVPVAHPSRRRASRGSSG